MRHVMVVDDDPDTREMLKTFLEQSGYTIAAAANGAEALTRLRQQRPCVILLDLMMPVMSGWEFRARQLQDGQLARIPVICISAAFHPDTVAERMGLRCLQKPLDLDRVLEVLDDVCGPDTQPAPGA